ncbi:SRPBCC family protein [Nocardia pseudobrasiliensis]|uniref:Activator of Hsp90 ATPase-like protein n=1 Tax=Nocardia pseudobrasiliensis TaxID=45979 RepID=A0A370I2Y2_9NOCA|nr:SRPBCC family protein [Nocardia pseudobrasiliensis]RDI65099.1 activator of Hsp90 ATPase-like protein [Nocardia pseudobrasiliensis]
MALLTDPAAVAGLVVREVHTGARDGMPTRIAIARRDYATDQADLWDALTTAERIPRWFLPVTGELKVGGSYQLEGNAHGVVEECDAPRRFTVTWEMGPQISWVQVTLTPDADHTTLELRHEAVIDPGMWTQYGPGAVGVGWDLVLMSLGLHLASGEAVDPEEGLTFPTTPEGITFVRVAANGWADAAIADGDDPTVARTAAEQTITFYTVEPEEGSQS